MYTLAILGAAAIVIWLCATGVTRGRRARVLAGAGVAVVVSGLFAFMTLWTDLLWFDAAGYRTRFFTMLFARIGAVAIGGALAAIGVLGLTIPVRFGRPSFRAVPAGLALLGGGLWGVAVWDEALLFLYRVSGGPVDPVLGHEIATYLFVLPFVDHVFWLLLGVALLALGTGLPSVLPPSEASLTARLRLGDPASLRPIQVPAIALASVLALGAALASFHLLYSAWGVVAGVGWIDANVRLPAYWLVCAATIAIAVAPAIGPMRLWLGRLARRLLRIESLPVGALTLAWCGILVTWIFCLVLVPALIQRFIVQPNEISFERSYIAHNIEFTRRAFGLHEIEERQFAASGELTRAMVERSPHLLDEARLWDWRALTAVYKQFQEIRLYYEFNDVDMDRYSIDGRYRQVMVSARELDQANLPESSRTYVNERYKYTHGYGLTLATVRDFTPDGLPNLLVRDIPPRVSSASLRVDRPQIYYGELTGDPAIVRTREQEFDYPKGDANAYNRYDGAGGVPLESLWRKLAFGWRFDGTRFFLSYYPTPETRILFRRQIRERVSTLAPFLVIDDDPYLVLADGRLFWILDAYTTSRYYPYSEPFSGAERIDIPGARGTNRLSSAVVPALRGSNYVRNSVKAVVDAYDGTVSLYVFDEEDPVLRVWRRVFPALFRDRTEMPEAIRAHVRYPQDFLLAQGLVYSKYHMTDPDVFYNQEDLWVRATENYYDAVQAVEPYYVMWKHPESERAEFVLMIPFTPKGRQVLIGWIAGLCDGDNYGRFIAYKFPKERHVLGPQQVETKIDQDRFLSAQLTLWDQRGSSVIRGNVLAIPIEDTLVYVEPIYLQAETAAYPELRLVAVMHDDDLSYAETFEDALAGLFEPGSGPGLLPSDPAGLIARLREYFDLYLTAQAERRFTDAAVALGRLDDALRETRPAPVD